MIWWQIKFKIKIVIQLVIVLSSIEIDVAIESVKKSNKIDEVTTITRI